MISQSLKTAWAEVAFKRAKSDPKNPFELGKSEFTGYLDRLFNKEELRDANAGNLASYYVLISKACNRDIIGNEERAAMIAKHTLGVFENMMIKLAQRPK
ncbi:MAG: hypothetical protein AAF549_08160 [Pseudomonadota bacterium]